MSVLLILILASLGMALAFLGAFIWAVRSGQFEDTCTPSMRILTDDTRSKPVSTSTSPENSNGQKP
jgi:cbb3-type cytochrome oxidase maturation protein